MREPVSTPMSRIGRWAAVGGLILLLVLFPCSAASANPPDSDYEGPEKCAECHQEETEAWHDSPHAMALRNAELALRTACLATDEGTDCTCLECHTTAFDAEAHTYVDEGVTCEECHGPYNEGHPEHGTMALDADSCVCADCHQETATEWKDSPHGQANVQCIGCHQVHTQETRFEGRELCQTCHRELGDDPLHMAHQDTEIVCSDCHLAHHEVETGNMEGAVGRPQELVSHELLVSDSAACVTCHADATLHTASYVEFPPANLGFTADEMARMTNKYEQAASSAGNWQLLSLLGLGLGLGVGGVLGVIGMLAFSCIYQQRGER